MGKAWRACLSPIPLSSAGAHHSDETIAAHVIAYSSMEIGRESGVPTYAGGLGALAGDTIRSAADLKAPLVAVTLLHRKGYFAQRLDPTGWQLETPDSLPVEKFLHEMPPMSASFRRKRLPRTGAPG